MEKFAMRWPLTLSPLKPRQNAEKISKTKEEIIYGDILHINHSFNKTVPKIQFTTWPRP
jgi:hypothetical protein